MDSIDRKILARVQEDATVSIADLAATVGLSTTPCWRRLRKLETAGVIKRRVALVDPEKVGLGLSVFVSIRTNRHGIEWMEKFTRAVTKLPEVVEFYRLAGENDYLLRVLVRDIPSYDDFYKRLIRIADLANVTSSFAMEQIKYTTAVPVEGAE